jgi:hypothetical protein
LAEDRPPTLYGVHQYVRGGHVRGTEGTGEFERYTPAEYIASARSVLGAIDLDPASNAQAQRIVKAAHYLTIEDDGLAHPWQGRVWLTWIIREASRNGVWRGVGGVVFRGVGDAVIGV